MDKHYTRSEDYALADKLLRVSGEPLAVWLTNKDDLTTFHLIAYSDDGLRVDGYPSDWVKYQSDFFEYCKEKQAQFLLPVALGVNADRVSVLECALADMSKESRDRGIRVEELTDENEHQKKLLEKFRIAVNSNDKAETIRLLQSQIEGFKALLEDHHKTRTERDYYRSILDKLCDRLKIYGASSFDDLVGFVDRLMSCSTNGATLAKPDDYELSPISRLVAAGQVIEDRDRDIKRLYPLNDTANQALNNIAFQLGFSSFDDEEVALRIDRLMAESKESSERVLERDRTISNYKLEGEDYTNQIKILEENLNRARAEHLEQLRAILQYVEQLGNFPNVTEKALGAIYLLSKVVYANIEKLDPNL